MKKLSEILTKQELRRVLGFKKNLEKWMLEFEADSIERLYFERAIKDIHSLEIDYKKEFIIDVYYVIGLLKQHIGCIVEEFRGRNKRRYNSSFTVWELLQESYNR